MSAMKNITLLSATIGLKNNPISKETKTKIHDDKKDVKFQFDEETPILTDNFNHQQQVFPYQAPPYFFNIPGFPPQ